MDRQMNIAQFNSSHTMESVEAKYINLLAIVVARIMVLRKYFHLPMLQQLMTIPYQPIGGSGVKKRGFQHINMC